MDIYYNAKLYNTLSDATAIAVSDGQIRAIGSNEDILATFGKTADVCINLEGHLVMAGFVDSHMHLVHDALEQSYVDLSQTTCFDDVRRLCLEQLDECRALNRPLRGSGFNHNEWTVPVLPTRNDLDEIAGDIPVVLVRTCHHIMICNTKALELFDGVDQFPDGILREDEQNFLEAALPPLEKNRIKELILDETHRAAACGITAIYSDDLMLLPTEPYGKTVLDAYMELDKAGQLPLRIVEQCNLPSLERLMAFLDAGYRTGDSGGMFTIGPLKLLGDGAIGARTAALSNDYADDPGNRGILNFDNKSLYELCLLAHRNDMQIAIHGIGDACIQQILDTYTKIQMEHPRQDARHGIVHCQFTTSEQIRQIRNLNLIVYIQPAFLRADQHIAADRVREELLRTSYDWRTMKDLGIHLCGGSDCPVESFDPLLGIYYAVTRQDPGSDLPWEAEKGLTLSDAIDLYTVEGAYAAFADNKRGKLAPGYAADFCVLDTDITTEPLDTLPATKVLMTVVNGKPAYNTTKRKA